MIRFLYAPGLLKTQSVRLKAYFINGLLRFLIFICSSVLLFFIIPFVRLDVLFHDSSFIINNAIPETVKSFDIKTFMWFPWILLAVLLIGESLRNLWNSIYYFRGYFNLKKHMKLRQTITGLNPDVVDFIRIDCLKKTDYD